MGRRLLLGRGAPRRVWDAATGRPTGRFAGPPAAVGVALGFTPDRAALVVVSHEAVPYRSEPPYLGPDWPVTVRRYDLGTGRERSAARLVGVNVAHMMYHVAVSPDGTGVFVGIGFGGGNASCPLARFDSRTGRRVWAFNPGEFGATEGLAVTPDGRTVAVGRTHGGGVYLFARPPEPGPAG